MSVTGKATAHDSQARVRAAAATIPSGRPVGGAGTPHRTHDHTAASSRTLPSAGPTSADASKYTKRRRGGYLRCLGRAATPTHGGALLTTMGVTLLLVGLRAYHSSSSSPTLARKPFTAHMRDQLLSHLSPRHHDRDRPPLPHPHDASSRHETAFANARAQWDMTSATSTAHMDTILSEWLAEVDHDIRSNANAGVRWIRPYLLPPLVRRHGEDDAAAAQGRATRRNLRNDATFFKVNRQRTRDWAWEKEWQHMQRTGTTPGPKVDYTQPDLYQYPTLPDAPEELPVNPAKYPPLQPLAQLLEAWPQDEDYDLQRQGRIREQLWHFNFSDPQQLAMAQVLRDNEIPFKLYNVPELTAASAKWTDEYVSAGFGGARGRGIAGRLFGTSIPPPANGVAQESPNNFFAFFIPKSWNIHRMGLPPTRNNDWTFEQWAKHARYADATRLSHNQPHFYWQAGVDRMERYSDSSAWTFISRDLPSFSTPTGSFFVFHPQEQKGIQCRFGERGVVAATHYDGGRNFVGMITGAKRYILSPPNQCNKLGVFTSKNSPIFRHSLLNFAHIQYLKKEEHGEEKGMSDEERQWLERAGQALSVETVLKAGEALYIPSHWFHYIISVQKSAQCNVRSGIDHEGHPAFGNRETVEQCRDE